MEERDLQLIEKLLSENTELKGLWEEHLNYEDELEQFNKKKYLSAEDELKRRELQKLKLAGKDQIEQILQQHRGA